MQQYFRVALGMCLLIAYLQAHPLRCLLDADNLGLHLLTDVSCKPNVNFTSPKPLRSVCRATILKLQEGWEHARANCEPAHAIDQTLDVLRYVLNNMAPQPECDFTMEVYSNYTSFLNATIEVTQMCHS